MSQSDVVYFGGPIFDGERLRDGQAARFRDGRFAEAIAVADVPEGAKAIDLEGDILSPGYVDLQVNGGGGVMFNDDPSVATLAQIAAAHRPLGAVRILPTLITDTPEKTRVAIDAAIAAVGEGVPGIAGLHLEGPHLSVARKGAHDANLIRSMRADDLAHLLLAAQNLPALMVTIAPETVTIGQVEAMADAGIIVSLGHTDADFDTCVAYARAGAGCVTHLFNAMSQLGHRAPGLVGAALGLGELSAGLIADGIHVHPAAMGAAWAAKEGPGRIFLVSDAMAVAGTDQSEFQLEGRRIRREGGRLTLEDGTLAGADLDLTTAVRTMVTSIGAGVEEALAAATSVPAGLIGVDVSLSTSRPRAEDFIRIRPDFSGVSLLTGE